MQTMPSRELDMDLTSPSGTPITAEEDVKHVKPSILNRQAQSAKHIASEQSPHNIHISTSQHCLHHLPAKRRHQLRAWTQVTNGHDLPKSLLNTQFETRIADHVLLENTVMDVVSLGMLIIDDVYPESGPPTLGILGGAGTYATVGARLFYPEEDSKNVGFIVHTGSDFSRETREEIESWKSGSHFVNTPDRETTRGSNVYMNDIRYFEFLTDKIQVDHLSLPDHYVTAKVFHLICGPVRCVEVVEGIIARRRELLSSVSGLSGRISEKPKFVWEPMEGFCEPRNRALFYEALKHVDVFSPNMHELSLLFRDQQGIQVTPEYAQELAGFGLNTTWSTALRALKSTKGQCRQLQAKGFEDPDKALVIRQGENGCTVLVNGHTTSFPAYHAPRHELTYTEKRLRKNKVVDVTGGGNAFLGGFCAGLAQAISEDQSVPLLFEIAAAYGGVAASFAIEQVGLPKLTPRKVDGAERWNGSLPFERVRKMAENAHRRDSVSEDWMSFLLEWIRSVEIDNV
ncbi:hypothetical protein N7G274_010657 [Stereocaulon virgatum]|uniref:Carbohydrate kinase PfkB domain-containing protein n=1 Tax=Stereocaulon virgatum TaxID=373712 RepID=A0ABR3ZV89_9LECA